MRTDHTPYVRPIVREIVDRQVFLSELRKRQLAAQHAAQLQPKPRPSQHGWHPDRHHGLL